MDLVEEKDRLLVQLELPGIDPKNVEINLQGDLLTVSGERKDSSERTEGKVLKREQSYGAFQRTLQLPFRVQSEKVKATYEKGVMTISLPKVEEQVGRQIPVDVK
jgi:HSP20 family protein